MARKKISPRGGNGSTAPHAEVEQPPFTPPQTSSAFPSFSLLSNGLCPTSLRRWNAKWFSSCPHSLTPHLKTVIRFSCDRCSANKGEEKVGSMLQTLARDVFELRKSMLESSVGPCKYFGQTSSFCGHVRYLESAASPQIAVPCDYDNQNGNTWFENCCLKLQFPISPQYCF